MAKIWMRDYIVQAPDPLAVAKAFGIPMLDLVGRLGVTGERIRQMAKDPRHAGRVRCAVLELALEHERQATTR